MPSYSVNITSNALDFIHTNILPPNHAGNYALIILNASVTGAGYSFGSALYERIKVLASYVMIFAPDYHNHGFAIFVEKIIIAEDYLPNNFVIDVLEKRNGTQVLDIKNPEFES